MRGKPPSPVPDSSFRVIYEMERECAWCLIEVLNNATLKNRKWPLMILRPYHLR